MYDNASVVSTGPTNPSTPQPERKEKKEKKSRFFVALDVAAPSSHPPPPPRHVAGARSVFDDPLVISIGKKHGVSPAQVALRWLVQQNISIVTAAETPEYIKEDMDLFSFELTAPEMEALAAL